MPASFNAMRLFRLLALAGLGTFGLWQQAPYAGGADSSGYLNASRLFRNGSASIQGLEIPGLLEATTGPSPILPLGFVTRKSDGRLVASYPPGFPALLAGTSMITGADAAPAILNVIALLAFTYLTYRLARRFGAGQGWSFFAAAVAGSSPLTLFLSVQPMSDIHAAAWFAASFWFALRGVRRGAPWFALAGVLFAVSVLIRPTTVVLLPALLVLSGPSMRRLGALAVTGAPFALLLGAYQQAMFGSPLATGYGPLSTAFALEFVPGSISAYASWLWVLVTPVALVALLAPWCTRGEPRLGVALTLWWLCSLVFYAFYYHTGEAWWYLRFIIPASPALIVAGTLAVAAITRRATEGWPGALRSAPLAIALAGLVFHSVFWNHRLHVLHVKPNERNYAVTSGMAREIIPADAIVASMQFSGSLTYYSDLQIVRYDWLQESSLPVLLAALESSGRPLFAVLQPWEFEACRAAIPGDWEVVAETGSNQIWKWHPSRVEP